MADITADELAEFHTLDLERLELDRKSRSIDGRLKPLREKFLDHLTAEKKLHVRRGNYELQLVEGAPYVNWSEQFIRVAGREAADTVKASTAPSRRVKVIDVSTVTEAA